MNCKFNNNVFTSYRFNASACSDVRLEENNNCLFCINMLLNEDYENIYVSFYDEPFSLKFLLVVTPFSFKHSLHMSRVNYYKTKFTVILESRFDKWEIYSITEILMKCISMSRSFASWRIYSCTHYFEYFTTWYKVLYVGRHSPVDVISPYIWFVSCAPTLMLLSFICVLLWQCIYIWSHVLVLPVLGACLVVIL